MPNKDGEHGFTLLEMLVVLVIVGLALGVVAMRGPRTSVGLDLKGTAGTVSDMLRQARSRSVANNRAVGVVFDVNAHALRLDNGAPVFLSPGVAIAVTATAENVLGTGAATGGLAAIRFAPDGSSSGGRVVLREGGREVQVGVDWLTGRVSVGS